MKLQSLGALVLATAMVGGTSEVAAQDQELTVAGSGGSFQDALTRHFYTRFEEQTGARVVHVPVEGSDQFTRVRAMSQAGQVEWDLMSPEPQSFYLDQDLLEPLDCSRIPNAEKFGVPGTCGEYGLFRAIGGGVLTYNTDEFSGNAPDTWADFWDVETFPGPRCLSGILPHYMIATALLADGVAPDALFPMDIDRAIAKLEEIKPHVAVWWSSGNQSIDTLRQGECVMSWMWSGRALQLIADGQPIAITWNQNQPVLAFWSILKDAPNKDLAYEFLNFWMTEPEAHIAFTSEIFYDTANVQALENLTPDQIPLRAIAEPNLNAQVPFDWEWVADNADEMRASFQEMITR